MRKKERRSKSKTVHTHVTEMYIMREMDRDNDETTKRQSAIVLERRRQKTASVRQRTKRISQGYASNISQDWIFKTHVCIAYVERTRIPPMQNAQKPILYRWKKIYYKKKTGINEEKENVG